MRCKAAFAGEIELVPRHGAGAVEHNGEVEGATLRGLRTRATLKFNKQVARATHYGRERGFGKYGDANGRFIRVHIRNSFVVLSTLNTCR